MDNLETPRRAGQYRGPTTSDDFNARIEQNYVDLVGLHQGIGQTRDDMLKVFRNKSKNIFSIASVLENVTNRIEALEAGETDILFYSTDKIENNRFKDTEFEIPTVSKCTPNTEYGYVTLPFLAEASTSKVKFSSETGSTLVPSALEAFAFGADSTADNSTAFVDSTPITDSMLGLHYRFWERNVVVPTTNENGAAMVLYVKLPPGLAVIADSNCIVLDPYPIFSVDILSISYSTVASPTLSDSDNYLPINVNAFSEGEQDAIGFVAPGGWTGDTIRDSGPLKLYFTPKPITALKIEFKQRNAYVENSKTVYTYGMSNFDVRYDKFLDSGKFIIRYDALEDTTISELTVTPEIFNVSQAEIPKIFSYRVIWETSLNSGVYTTSSVPFSKKVWIEVTLNKPASGTPPMLSGLNVSYS